MTHRSTRPRPWHYVTLALLGLVALTLLGRSIAASIQHSREQARVQPRLTPARELTEGLVAVDTRLTATRQAIAAGDSFQIYAEIEAARSSVFLLQSAMRDYSAIVATEGSPAYPTFGLTDVPTFYATRIEQIATEFAITERSTPALAKLVADLHTDVQGMQAQFPLDLLQTGTWSELAYHLTPYCQVQPIAVQHGVVLGMDATSAQVCGSDP